MRTTLLIFALLASTASAQRMVYDDALQKKLDSAADQAQTLRTALPSFTCTETGTSEVLRTADRTVKKSVPFTGVIRARRVGEGQLVETNELTTVNGKQAGKHASVPYYVHDAFTRVLTYVDGPYQSCYVFTQSATDPARVDFTNAQPFDVRCANFPGTHGYFTTNAAGEMEHMERTLPVVEDDAWPVPFAAVDMATVDLGGKPYRLAAHMISERQRGREILREDVKYTDCRLFTSTIKILPGIETVPEDAPKP